MRTNAGQENSTPRSAIYTLLTTDLPWPDAVLVGTGAGGGALIVLCLAAQAALLVCIPVLPVVIIVTDVVRGIADGLRSTRTVDPPHEWDRFVRPLVELPQFKVPAGIGVEKTWATSPTRCLSAPDVGRPEAAAPTCRATKNRPAPPAEGNA